MSRSTNAAFVVAALAIPLLVAVVWFGSSLRPASSGPAGATPRVSRTQAASATQLEPVLTRDILDRSLELGRKFLLVNQRPEGNFTYEYDFVQRTLPPNDNSVRQAGALWGLGLINQDAPSVETVDAIVKGLAYFDRLSKETPDGRRYVVDPGGQTGATGEIALVALAIVEFLRSDQHPELHAGYKTELDHYLRFLLSLRMPNGQFHESFAVADGHGIGSSSPYSDGEVLLALVKATKYLAYPAVRSDLLESAESMYVNNVVEALKANPDSDTTKGFYQWGSMSFYEIYTAGWPGAEPYARRTIEMAHWMIDVHRVQARTRNTGYAFEGLASAWELARLTGDRAAMDKFGRAVNAGLYNLTSWQVGGPLENPFLVRHRTDDMLALGGVMNGQDDPVLRIDVTQHQMHAVILARRFIYRT